MNKFNRHKAAISILLFSSYFALFVFNIVHYHKYDINLSNSNLIVENTNKGESESHGVNIDFQCPVHNNYSSLHNILPYSLSGTPELFFSDERLSLPAAIYFPQNKFLHKNSLRAPPLQFS